MFCIFDFGDYVVSQSANTLVKSEPLENPGRGPSDLPKYLFNLMWYMLVFLSSNPKCQRGEDRTNGMTKSSDLKKL
jgi:hypothetical protein